MSVKHVHLQMIQSVITRMSLFSLVFKIINLFSIFSIVLVSLYIDKLVDYKPCLLIIFVCYYFDAFYLKQERSYRYLYSTVIDKDSTCIDFDMNAYVFRLRYSLIKMALSRNLIFLYGVSSCLVLFLNAKQCY